MKVPNFKYVDAENKFRVYTNHTGVSMSNFDLKIMFGEVDTGNETEVTIIQNGSVVMSPLHAKLFCKNLAENIAKFESMFGEIKLSEKHFEIKISPK